MKVIYKSIREQIQKAVDEQTPGKRIDRIELDADEWGVLYHELRDSADASEVAVSHTIDAGFTTASACGVSVALVRT